MISKGYYITTLGEWRKKILGLGASHWIPIDPANSNPQEADKILVVVESDEGGHSELESMWQALPHPQSQKPIPADVAMALSLHGVKVGATTFDVSEIAGAIHPLMKWR